MNKTLQEFYDKPVTSNEADEVVHYSLRDLMSQVLPENLHEHIDFGKPVGKEILK